MFRLQERIAQGLQSQAAPFLQLEDFETIREIRPAARGSARETQLELVNLRNRPPWLGCHAVCTTDPVIRVPPLFGAEQRAAIATHESAEDVFIVVVRFGVQEVTR